MYPNYSNAGGFHQEAVGYPPNAMYRHPPPAFLRWSPVQQFGLPGAPSPPCFNIPPPCYPMPPGSGWNPSMGFPPRPFTPRARQTALVPPPRAMPPSAVPPPRRLPTGAVPPPTPLPPGAVPLPIGVPSHGVIPPPRGLPGYLPHPRKFFPFRGPPPSIRPPGGKALGAVNDFSISSTGLTNGLWKNNPDSHWSSKKRKADGSFTKQNRQKRQKINKRDLPENNVYVCETCDRGFKTEDLYRTHVNGHETCHVDGCQFTAHPKLVRIHFDCQHRSGFAKKIWQMQSKEDIKNWISDRKKNYPTKENLEKKKQAREEKIKRGEVLENKYFGKFRRPGRGRGGHFGRQGYNRHSHTENEEFRNAVNNNDNCSVPKLLLEKDNIQNQTANSVPSQKKESVSDDSQLQRKRKLRKAGRRNFPANHQSPLANVTSKARKLPTLLEQLLANDIRHERNVLLQCIRYIVSRFHLSEEVEQIGRSSGARDEISDLEDADSSRSILEVELTQTGNKTVGNIEEISRDVKDSAILTNTCQKSENLDAAEVACATLDDTKDLPVMV